MAENIQLPSENPLNYGKMRSKNFLNLVYVAHRFLAVPLSSVSYDQLFKVRKRVIIDKLSQLLPYNADMFIRLNYNVRTVSYTVPVLKKQMVQKQT